LRYRLLDREHALFGLLIDAEPRWGRIDETTGEPVDQYGIDLTIAIDKELIPNRIVAAFNAIYAPNVFRSRETGVTFHESTLGFSTALMTQVRPGIFSEPRRAICEGMQGLASIRLQVMRCSLVRLSTPTSPSAPGLQLVGAHRLQAERPATRVGSILPPLSGTKRDFCSALPFDEQPP